MRAGTREDFDFNYNISNTNNSFSFHWQSLLLLNLSLTSEAGKGRWLWINSAVLLHVHLLEEELSEGVDVVETTVTCGDVSLQNTRGSVCKAWCSSFSVGDLPARYRGGSAQVCVCVCMYECECVSRLTHWDTNLMMHQILRVRPKLSQNLSWKHTNQKKTGTLSSALIVTALVPVCVSVCVCVSACVCVCLRCLGREGGNSRGCRRQVTRRRTASYGEALYERSEDTAVLSVDTRRGKQHRSRHTCTHTTTTQVSVGRPKEITILVTLACKSQTLFTVTSTANLRLSLWYSEKI